MHASLKNRFLYHHDQDTTPITLLSLEEFRTNLTENIQTVIYELIWKILMKTLLNSV